MNEQREALASVLKMHLPKDRYNDEGDPVGTFCTGCDWTGDYFADGEAGPFDDHLADALLASDALARLLADAEQRGAARVAAAVGTVCDEVSDATRGSLDEAQSFGGALVGAVNIYSHGFDRIRGVLAPDAAETLGQ